MLDFVSDLVTEGVLCLSDSMGADELQAVLTEMKDLRRLAPRDRGSRSATCH